MGIFDKLVKSLLGNTSHPPEILEFIYSNSKNTNVLTPFTINHKYFLSRFYRASTAEWFDHDSYWNEPYARRLKADPVEVFEAFIRDEYVREVTPHENIDVVLTMPKIKELLKRYGEKTSGKKADLIERLLSVAPNPAAYLPDKNRYYVVTEKGKKIVESFFRSEEKRKVTALNKFLDLFYAGNLVEAEKTVCRYRNGTIEGRLLSSDSDDRSVPLYRLQYLPKHIPSLLSDITPEQFAIASGIAAANESFGEYVHPKEILEMEAANGLTLKEVSLVLSKTMWYKDELKRAKESNYIKFIWFSGDPEDQCAECRKLLGTRSLSSLMMPMLPNPKCLNHGLCTIPIMGTPHKDPYK